MDVSGATAFAAPREEMNDLYQKINKYVYEIRMVEIDEYVDGMNRKKIDMEEAYEMIIGAPDSEYKAIMNVWKGRFADPWLPFYKSSIIEKNESRAKAFYRKAVDLDIERMTEAGDQYAQSCLGLMYRFGRGVDENNSTALEWYRKAAKQGHADAQNNLGWMYRNGEGVDQNDSTALEWFLKAAGQGHAHAQNSLGLMYANGRGVNKNDSTAVEWYRKAAEQGYANAQNNLGVMYANGRGVDKNDSTAVFWYRKAAEQAHAGSQNNLGVMYENGQGVDQNDSTAVEWYRKAVEQYHAIAQYNLDFLTNKLSKEKNRKGGKKFQS